MGGRGEGGCGGKGEGGCGGKGGGGVWGEARRSFKLQVLDRKFLQK